MLRTHKRVTKEILTTQGKIRYSRYVLRPSDEENREKLWSAAGKRAVVPLDEALGTDNLPFKISIPMMIEISYWAAKFNSYQAAEDFFRRAMNIGIGDDSIRKVVNYIGDIVFRNDCRLAESAYDELMSGQLQFPKDKKGVLYIQTDGAALNTRTPDENNSTWRENKLGIAFSSDDIHWWKGQNGDRKHQILNREYISFIGSVQEFKKHFLALALRNGYGQYKDTVLISDGATWIRNIREELFPDAQQILDLFHLKENVYDFAKAIFHDSKEKYEPWAKDICQKLEDGKWKEVLHELEEYKSFSLNPGRVNLYTYIWNNQKNIDYPAYKKKGYFVGSGAIESGNKIVLQSRLKQAGMRWNIPTAQKMISLKAKIESGLWDKEVVPLIYEKMGAHR